MIRNILIFWFFVMCVLVGCAQQKITNPPFYAEQDSLYFRNVENLLIDFDVQQKFGCEYLITQILNFTQYTLEEDSLFFLWNIYNEDKTLNLTYFDESPDIFIYEPGDYHVKLVVSNESGIMDSLIKENLISIDKMPEIDFTFAPENALFAEYFGEVEFFNLTDPKLYNDTTVEWYWDFGDGELNSKEWAPVHLFSSWGDFHTTFHLKTKNGCKVALTKTVIIEEELFFPNLLKKNSKNCSSFFAITNLNTNIPADDPTHFRTNYLFVYNEFGAKVYEQNNYDSYIKNNTAIEGNHTLRAEVLPEGKFYYSFFYQGKNKIVHYSGEFFVF